MKRLAVVVALAGLWVLPGCTTIHPERRTLTNWNLELIKEAASPGPQPVDSIYDFDGVANPIANWLLVEPLAVVMFPASWVTGTLILNPINGWQKAELQVHERRFGRDDERGAAESALKSGYAMAPWAPPAPVGDALAFPEFVGHWLWNSIYPTGPVSKAGYNLYWDEHNEDTAD